MTLTETTSRYPDLTPTDPRTRSFFHRLAANVGDLQPVPEYAADAVFQCLLNDHDVYGIDRAFIPRQFSLFEEWGLWERCNDGFLILPRGRALEKDRPFTGPLPEPDPLGGIHRDGRGRLVLTRSQTDWYLALMTGNGRNCTISLDHALFVLRRLLQAFGIERGEQDVLPIFTGLEQSYEIELCDENGTHGHRAVHVLRAGRAVAEETIVPRLLLERY